MATKRVKYDGEKFAASIQARVNLAIDSKLESKARGVNTELSKFVNKAIDRMFIEAVAKEGITKQINSAPPNLMKHTNTFWSQLKDSTVQRKRAKGSSNPETIYKDEGELETALGSSPIGTSVSQAFGGYSNKSANISYSVNFTRASGSVTQGLRPVRAGGKAPKFKKVLTFSVFHALRSRAVPETIMDNIYGSDSDGIPMSLKLGYYRKTNRPIKHKRSLLIPYADYFVRVKLPKKVQDWARRQN